MFEKIIIFVVSGCNHKSVCVHQLLGEKIKRVAYSVLFLGINNKKKKKNQTR